MIKQADIKQNVIAGYCRKCRQLTTVTVKGEFLCGNCLVIAVQAQAREELRQAQLEAITKQAAANSNGPIN